jgi:hypothetical protein
MRRSSLMTAVFGSVAVAAFVCSTAFAQSAAAPSQAQSGNWGMMGGGPGMMGGAPGTTGGPGMMGGYPMMAMPMYPCGEMGSGMMTGGAQDPKTAAKMMEMHAEMMRSNAAIMEKYAKQLESEK